MLIKRRREKKSHPSLLELVFADDSGAVHHILPGPEGDAVLDAAITRGGGELAGKTRVDTPRALRVRTHVAAVRLCERRYEVPLRCGRREDREESAEGYREIRGREEGRAGSGVVCFNRLSFVSRDIY